jgi:hypothetical protein
VLTTTANLIVAHEVTNIGHDRDQLSSMAHQARDAIDKDNLTVFADRGYYKGEQILECEQAGVKTLVPMPQISGNKAGARRCARCHAEAAQPNPAGFHVYDARPLNTLSERSRCGWERRTS